MPIAIDTVLTYKANAGAAYTATAAASGDSLTVRNYAQGSTAQLEQLIRESATKGGVRVRSPLFADDTTGINFETSETPSVLLLPPEVGQPLRSGDTLIVEVTGGTAEDTLAVLVNYYQDLPGAKPRLHSWGDIAGNIANIKSVQVAVEASASVGTWVDTVITTTEDLLHADTDYAVLGYVTDEALGVVAIKGTDTSNLRIGGPGSTGTRDCSEWFVEQSDRHGTPHIPVFNANNRQSTFVSVADASASTAANVTLVLAQLATNLAS